MTTCPSSTSLTPYHPHKIIQNYGTMKKDVPYPKHSIHHTYTPSDALPKNRSKPNMPDTHLPIPHQPQMPTLNNLRQCLAQTIPTKHQHQPYTPNPLSPTTPLFQPTHTSTTQPPPPGTSTSTRPSTNQHTLTTLSLSPHHTTNAPTPITP